MNGSSSHISLLLATLKFMKARHSQVQELLMDGMRRRIVCSGGRGHLILRGGTVGPFESFLRHRKEREAEFRGLPWLSGSPLSRRPDCSSRWRWSAWFWPSRWLCCVNSGLPRSARPKGMQEEDVSGRLTAIRKPGQHPGRARASSVYKCWTKVSPVGSFLQ